MSCHPIFFIEGQTANIFIDVCRGKAKDALIRTGSVVVLEYGGRLVFKVSGKLFEKLKGVKSAAEMRPILATTSEVISQYGDDALELFLKYDEEAINLIKKGFEPKLIKRLDGLGITPGDFERLSIVSKEVAEEVAECISRYGDAAAKAIKTGIDPSLIKSLAKVEVTPSLYQTLSITSRESAESLLGAIARRLSRTATQADIDLINSLRIKYNAGTGRNIAFAKGNIGDDIINIESVSGEFTSANYTQKGNFMHPNESHYQGRLGYEYHTEQKIIEHLRETYKNNPNISGRIELVSERPYCDNCVDIVDQFQAEFKNIEVVRVEIQ